MTTLDITNNWKLVDTNNIEGRLNVMWLTADGVGLSTREYSHMTMLNMILEKSNITDFWNIDEIKKHNIHDVIQLENKKFKNNNVDLAELMTKFMKETKFIRISGPFREVEFGGSNFGHASKLLENRHFVYEYYKDMTKKQKEFIDKVIDVYNLSDDEIQEIHYD